MESNMIQLGIAAASILIPLAVDMIEKAQRPDGTQLTEQEIAELRAFVDANHQLVQGLPEGSG